MCCLRHFGRFLLFFSLPFWLLCVCDDRCLVIIQHSVIFSSLFDRCALPFTLTTFIYFCLFSRSFLNSGLCETNQLQECMRSHMFWNIINSDEEFLCFSTEYKSWRHYTHTHTCTHNQNAACVAALLSCLFTHYAQCLMRRCRILYCPVQMSYMMFCCWLCFFSVLFSIQHSLRSPFPFLTFRLASFGLCAHVDGLNTKSRTWCANRL